jgi:tetratricopeptide (TPR) repeat protein
MISPDVHVSLTSWELGILEKDSSQELSEKLPLLQAKIKQWQNFNSPNLFTEWRECADLACRTYNAAILDQLLIGLFDYNFPVVDFNKAWLSFYRGEHFWINLEFETAVDFYVKTVPIARKTDNAVAMFRGLLALTRTFFNLEEYRRAESNAIKVLSVSDEPAYAPFKAVALFDLGQICAKLGNPVGAEWYTLNSVKLALQIESPFKVCLSAAEFLSRLLHKKLMKQDPEETLTIFLKTREWLKKGLQGSADAQAIESYLDLFLQEGLRDIAF